MKAFRWNRWWSVGTALVGLTLWSLIPRGGKAPSGVRITRAAELEEATKADPFVVYRGTGGAFHRFSAIDGRAFAVPEGELAVPNATPIDAGIVQHVAIRGARVVPPDASRVEAWVRTRSGRR